MTDRLAALVVIALCIVGLAFAAASLSSAPQEESGTGNGSGPPGMNVPTRTEQPTSGPDLPTSLLPGWIVSKLLPLVLLLALPAVIIARGDVIRGGLIALGIFALYAVVVFLTGGDPGLSQSGAANATPRAANGSSGSEIAASDGSSSLFLYGAVGVALLVAAGAVVYASRTVDDAADLLEDDESESEPGPEAVADAAARAAEAIEASGEADLSNAVYEAWHEMTDAVDVSNPATATPREFADAAIAAGVDRRPVEELTDVFEAVRYGDEPAKYYETQAVEALRAIESDLDGENTSRSGQGSRPADRDEGSDE